VFDIRDATEVDIPGMVEVISGQPLWSRYGYSRERQAHDLRDALSKGDVLLIAGNSERILGLVWVQARAAFGRSPYLRLLAVRQGNERRGLGTRLLSAAEVRCRRSELFLLVSEDNAPARSFYEHHGCEIVGRLPGYVRPGIVELLYWKSRIELDR